METASSLRQTVTHLFDAVRYSSHAKELEDAAKEAESRLEVELNKLESHSENLANLLSSMDSESAEPLKELSKQLEEFLATAKEQAKEKLERSAKEEIEDLRNSASSEKDKALKSLEAFLASDPLPIIESQVQVRFNEGVYEARSRHECEGGMRYDFRLAAQNSRLFHQELTLSQLGYELRVPVRFSRGLLSKARVPGFERLDQYALHNAETAGGRIRATFQKVGNGASMKITTSGSGPEDFVGLEYSDQSESVNVMNDPALSAHVDLEKVRKAMEDLVREMGDLAKKKVALLKLTLDGDEAADDVDYYGVLQLVLKTLGPSYKGVIAKLTSGDPKSGAQEGLSMNFLRERLKVLGSLSKNVSQALGLPPQ